MEQSYKEKYEDILARLERAKNDNKVCDERFCCVIDDLIPELAESEDEKVRKELTKHLKELSDWKEDDVIPVKNPSYYRQWASWLEKQAERKTPQWMIDFLDSYRRKIGCSLDHDEARDVEGKILCITQWLENQGQVKESTISQHEIETCKENNNSLTSEDEKVRKELIKHLKEGAEGYEPAGDSSDYQRWLAWVEKQGEHANFRNKIQVGDKVTRNEDGVLVNLSQLNRVAKKDENPADKVEPKFKVGEKELTNEELCEGLIRGMINEHNRVTKEILRTEYEKGRADAIAEMQKEWSEEDDSRYSSCLYMLEREPSLYNWLKSLKGRVQPKQEWSEEDKYMYDILCGTIENTDINENTKYKLISWLKSLRPQNRWKPSDEHISLLQAIINEPNNAASESCQIVLKDILEQLKKLKEE